ncbi:MAG: hypothetical protein WBM86_17650, partial [Waterburya sp.]
MIGTTLLIPILYILFSQQEQTNLLENLPFIASWFTLLDHYQPEAKLVIIIASMFLVIVFKNIFNY